MNLQPPSYFQVSPPKGTESLERSVLRKWREELARVNRENRLLRQRLEAAYGRPTGPFTDLATTTTTTVSPPLPPLHAPSEFLHVEECVLQSRLRLLESEKKEAALQLLQLEKSLSLHKEEFRKKLNDMKEEHAESMRIVNSEKQKILSEYQSYKKEKEKTCNVLSTELAIHQEHCSAQTKQLVLENANLKKKLTGIESDHHEIIRNLESELASVTNQLRQSKQECECLKNDTAAQLSNLAAEVTHHSLKVEELEAYLGGEIPELEAQKWGSTWKEERQALCSEIQRSKSEVEKFRSENYLLNVRLSSMSEILSLQESDITKGCKSDAEQVRGLLTRWREKVYELLVKRKLQEIDDIEHKQGVRKKETLLAERVEETERERQILEYGLADKSAQLQLQTTRTEALEEDLAVAKAMVAQLQERLHSKCMACKKAGKSVGAMARLFSDFRSTFNQALTRLASYQHRITFAIKRMQSLKAMFGYQGALQWSKRRTEQSHVECQVEPADSETALSSLTKQQLELEVQTLSQERDHLIRQLQESTEVFQTQLKSLEEKYLSGDKDLEGQLVESETECASLRESLGMLQDKLTASEGDRDNLSKMTQQLSRELEELKASMESRIAAEVSQQKLSSQEELCEMERLLNVARREHSKALVQLQQLTRRVAQGRDRVVQVAEMGRDKMEKELLASRKQLQTVQVERNLLRSTLRQEGGADGPSLPHIVPRDRDRGGTPPQHQKLSPSHRPGVSVTPPSPPPPLHLYSRALAGGGTPEPQSSSRGGSAACSPKEEEDIRDVLKDLRMLSASLLSLEPESGQQKQT